MLSPEFECISLSSSPKSASLQSQLLSKTNSYLKSNSYTKSTCSPSQLVHQINYFIMKLSTILLGASTLFLPATAGPLSQGNLGLSSPESVSSVTVPSPVTSSLSAGLGQTTDSLSKPTPPTTLRNGDHTIAARQTGSTRRFLTVTRFQPSS